MKIKFKKKKKKTFLLFLSGEWWGFSSSELISSAIGSAGTVVRYFAGKIGDEDLKTLICKLFSKNSKNTSIKIRIKYNKLI